MKKFCFQITLFSSIFFMSNLLGQDTKIGHFFKIKPNVVHPFQECDAIGNTAGFTTKIVPGTSKFTIVDKLPAGDYIIKFWAWENISNMPAPAGRVAVNALYMAPALTTAVSKAESFNYRVNGSNWDIRYFKITQAELELYTKELEAWLLATAGTAIMPFKLRPSRGDFSKDLTISNLGGIKHNFNENAGLSLLLGIGISSVKLDSNNTLGTIKKTSDFAALTISAGLVLEFKKLQVGLFSGWDHLAASDKNNWVYQGKTWLAIGIGFSLYSESNSKSKEGGN